MKIAIVGSRDYPRLVAVSGFVASLPADAVVVSGGAEGVDSQAVRMAIARGLKHHEFKVDTAGLPEDEQERRIEYAKRAYARNTKIVEWADEVVAFWTRCQRPYCRRPQPHKTHGTAHAISEARRLNKPLRLFGPSGQQTVPGIDLPSGLREEG